MIMETEMYEVSYFYGVYKLCLPHYYFDNLFENKDSLNYEHFIIKP